MYKKAMSNFTELLDKYGYTVASAAEKGVSKHTLYSLSCGRRNAGMKTIRQCSEILMIPIAEFMKLRDIEPAQCEAANGDKLHATS